MVKKVGIFKGSSYSRYKKPRDPKSGVEWVDRYSRKPYTHTYGSDIRTKKKCISGESKKAINKKPIYRSKRRPKR